MIKDEYIFIKNVVHAFFISLRKIFKYKQKDKNFSTKKILVAGGYGYGNTGDEAQCNATLKILKERFSDYQIINLTPNVDYSMQQHPEFVHEFASRVLFFNQRSKIDSYNFNNSNLKKLVFFLKSILILFNALLVRAGFPTFFINAETAKFLYELKTASLFYFCGGGYLTGSTLSRLWDGILICRLAHLFKLPVVMSGQTIGVWGTSFNKILAGWGFKHVSCITVRDVEFSLTDLKSVGLEGEHIFATHDDALGCEKSDKKQVDSKDYFALNFHYWGMNNSEKGEIINKLHKIITYILDSTSSDIVFIPMHKTDKDSFDDYIKNFPNERISCFDYDYDFRKVRRAIADSRACITMKHHPIIFAMGEDVPALSLAFSKYYVHKNIGALSQYGQDEFSVNLELDSYYEDFVCSFERICDNYDGIINKIKEQKEYLLEQKEKFLKKTEEILRGKNGR